MIDVNWLAFSPPLTLLISASFIVIFALFVTDTRISAVLSLVGLFISFGFTVVLFSQVQDAGMVSSFGLRYLADSMSLGFNMVIVLGAVIAILISFDYLRRTGLEHPEYYPLILLSSTGAMIMAAAGDLITLVLGLEIMSLAVYVLSAWRQNSRESEEAGLKYFLLGAFASAFFIYGIALTYGATGHFDYAGIAGVLAQESFNQVRLATLAAMFLLTGLGFKVAFAPFYQWAPDVYTGAPTAVTAFMSVVVKTGAFAGLVRLFTLLIPNISAVFVQVLVVVLLLTMLIGNLAALQQRGIKRMLAYSAVAHAGYLGMAVLAGNLAPSAIVWYLTAYTFMNTGAFAVLTLITDNQDHGDTLERVAGLGSKRPLLAAMLTLFLLSLAGIPPLAGFTGKVLVFGAALQTGYVYLAVVGILTSAVAVVYYFRPIVYMYFRDVEYEPINHTSPATYVAITIAALGTILFGLLPGWWYALLRGGEQLIANM
ncbi:MAG: NADH-quinone oxidoreductase subunit N [Deinococcota bacterium]